MKILIAVPTFENIMPDTFKSIYDLDKGGHDCIFEFVRGYDCATARNNIAQKAIDLKTDYVLMIDNDVIIPKNALINLLDDSKEVCLGYYPHRDAHNIYDGRQSVCKLGEKNYTQMYKACELEEFKAKGIYKLPIHGGGMGCALIKTNVFNYIKYPWFNWVNYEDRHGVLSEDLYFCSSCNGNNIVIYIDTRVGCGHIFRRAQWPT